MTVSTPALRQGKYFPLSYYQQRMLAAALDPETSVGFHINQTISWAVRITPGVSSRTLRRAFDQLVLRHDSLRLRFVELGNVWRAEILPNHPIGLIIEELGEMSEAAQKKAIMARCAKPLTALSDPMFEMCLLKFGGAGDVILVRVHHAIIDGYSIVLLLEELLKHALSMPVSESPLSHGDFISHRGKQILTRAEEKEAFWREGLFPLPEKLNIGRKAQGLPDLSPKNISKTKMLNDVLTPQVSAQVEVLVKNTGVSAFCHLHAAFSETLCAQAGQGAVLVHSVVGRREAAVASFIGAEMLEFPLRYSCGSGAGWVSEQISASAEMLPTSALDDDTLMGQEIRAKADWMRFLVHIRTPTGRFSTSPFRKIFEEAMIGKISFGFLTMERIDLPKEADSGFELQMNVTSSPQGPQASLIGNAASWGQADLGQLAQEIDARVQPN
ncbi:condensation domain-containing protein [Sulfitobacter dubius]|nr:condensation domain-containing protein [Sulfitobacter dubius]